MCLIKKKEALLKTEWHLTQSQPLLHQIFKEPSIFFITRKKKTNQNYEGFTYGIKPMALTVVPSFSQSQRTASSLGSRLPSLPKQIGQWTSLGKKSYPWYLRTRELLYFWWVTSSVWPSFQSLSARVWQVAPDWKLPSNFWCDESNRKWTQTSVCTSSFTKLPRLNMAMVFKLIILKNMPPSFKHQIILLPHISQVGTTETCQDFQK